MAEPSKKAKIGVILLTLFINMLGFGIVIPVLPLYAQDFGATEMQIGLLFASYSLCQFLFSPIIGKLSDKIGRRPVLIVSVIGTAAGFFIMGAANTLALLFVGRILDGVSGASIATCQAYLADVTTREERGKTMGLMGATFGLGFIFGPALGGLASAAYGSQAPFYIAGVLAVLNLFLVIRFVTESLTPELRAKASATKTEVPKENRATYYRVVLINFLAICGFAIMTTIFALYLKERFEYGAKEAGYLFAFIGVIAVLMQGGVLRRLLKNEGKEIPVAVSGAIILAISLAAMPFVGGLGALLFAVAGLAIGNSLISPTVSALASLCAGADSQGATLGVYQSAGSLGRAIGPFLAGWLLTVGTTGTYASTALYVSAGIIVLTLIVLLTVRPPKDA